MSRDISAFVVIALLVCGLCSIVTAVLVIGGERNAAIAAGAGYYDSAHRFVYECKP